MSSESFTTDIEEEEDGNNSIEDIIDIPITPSKKKNSIKKKKSYRLSKSSRNSNRFSTVSIEDVLKLYYDDVLSIYSKNDYSHKQNQSQNTFLGISSENDYKTAEESNSNLKREPEIIPNLKSNSNSNSKFNLREKVSNRRNNRKTTSIISLIESYRDSFIDETTTFNPTYTPLSPSDNDSIYDVYHKHPIDKKIPLNNNNKVNLDREFFLRQDTSDLVRPIRLDDSAVEYSFSSSDNNDNDTPTTDQLSQLELKDTTTSEISDEHFNNTTSSTDKSRKSRASNSPSHASQSPSLPPIHSQIEFQNTTSSTDKSRLSHVSHSASLPPLSSHIHNSLSNTMSSQIHSDSLSFESSYERIIEGAVQNMLHDINEENIVKPFSLNPTRTTFETDIESANTPRSFSTPNQNLRVINQSSSLSEIDSILPRLSETDIDEIRPMEQDFVSDLQLNDINNDVDVQRKQKRNVSSNVVNQNMYTGDLEVIGNQNIRIEGNHNISIQGNNNIQINGNNNIMVNGTVNNNNFSEVNGNRFEHIPKKPKKLTLSPEKLNFAIDNVPALSPTGLIESPNSIASSASSPASSITDEKMFHKTTILPITVPIQRNDSSSGNSFDSRPNEFGSIYSTWKIFGVLVSCMVIPPLFFIIGCGKKTGISNQSLLKLIISSDHKLKFLKGYYWNLDIGWFRRLCLILGIVEVICVCCCLGIGFGVGLGVR